jgi:hypothetical protein
LIGESSSVSETSGVWGGSGLPDGGAIGKK